MKKKRTKLLVFFALAGILVLFYMIGESYCCLLYTSNLKMGAFTRSDKNEIDATIEKVYKRFPRLKERQNQTAGTQMCIRDRSHILTKKSQKRKRNLRKSTVVDATNVKSMKKALPYL